MEGLAIASYRHRRKTWSRDRSGGRARGASASRGASTSAQTGSLGDRETHGHQRVDRPACARDAAVRRALPAHRVPAGHGRLPGGRPGHVPTRERAVGNEDNEAEHERRQNQTEAPSVATKGGVQGDEHRRAV